MEEAKPPAASKKKLWIAIAAVVVVVVVVVAAALAGLFTPEPAIVIGTVLPVTGDLELFGPSMRRSADLAVRHINEGGGVTIVVNGEEVTRNLALVHEDSQTAAAAGVSAAEKLVSVDGARVIIGAAASGVSRPIMESVSVPNRVVQISPASTSPFFTEFNEARAIGDRFFFRTAPSDAFQGRAGALYAFNELGWRNVAILARADPYGTGLASVFEDTFIELGGTITERVDYSVTATSFTSELTQIFDSNPEGIWWVAFPGEGEIIMTQWWANEAWKGPGAPVWLWAEGAKSQDFVDSLLAAGIDVKGMEGTSPIASLAVEDTFNAFKDAYTAAYGDFPDLPFDAHTYDAVFVAALAMEKGRSAQGESIRANLRDVANPGGTVISVGAAEWTRAKQLLADGTAINYEGASGSVDFDAFGDPGPSDYEIWRIDADGQIVRDRRIAGEDLFPSPPQMAPSAAVSLTASAQPATTWQPVAAAAKN